MLRNVANVDLIALLYFFVAEKATGKYIHFIIHVRWSLYCITCLVFLFMHLFLFTYFHIVYLDLLLIQLLS